MNSMRTRRLTAPAVILLLSASLSAEAPKKQPAHPTAKTHKTSHHPGRKARKPRGQQAIDGERARQIQAALIRQHYMNGEPSGKWDAPTQQAMQRYQADQGWQSKTTPDARALIRLGLGPDHVHLLNPESAMVSEPQLSGGARAATRVAALSPVLGQTVPAAAPSAKASTDVTAPVVTAPDISPGR